MYSATLNQTKVQSNNNKYYILQILQSDQNPNVNYFFTRWGRVGKEGQISSAGPYSIPTAISYYRAKHYDKTKKGDYIEIQLNYGDEEEEGKGNEKKEDQKSKDFEESQLEKEVKDFLDLIFDIGMMNNQMK